MLLLLGGLLMWVPVRADGQIFAITQISNTNVLVGTPITIQITLTNTTGANSQLTWVVGCSPATSASLWPTTTGPLGPTAFSWTPTKTQFVIFTISVSQFNTTNFSTTDFTVTVTNSTPAATPPYLALPFSVTNITAGKTLTFTALATNTDGSTNPLIFSLDGIGAAVGAIITNSTPTNGIFKWTPTADQGGYAYDMKVIINEQNTSLSATQWFTVNVLRDFTYTTNNGTITITGYIGPGGIVAIPEMISGLPVTSIGDWAFYSSSVTNVLIPDSVTNIGDGAFFDCGFLTNVTIGVSVTSISDWTFAFCSSLTSVCFRGNAPSLGGVDGFYGNVATVYYLPGTTNWGPTFDGHPAVLWNPPVPYTYTTNNCAITITGYTGSGGTVIIPSMINFLPVVSVGDVAFYGCSSLIGVTIPDTVTSIGDFTFANCSNLTEVTMSTNVTSIGDGAFNSCYRLTSITFPNSLTNIGNYSFAWCTNLTSIAIPNGVTIVMNSAFYHCSSLTNVTIPNTVTNIMRYAFADSTSLTNITIPSGVTSIGEGVFYECSSLTSMTIPNTVTDIGDYVFQGCTSLTSITIPDSVTSIGGYMFRFCSSLTNVTIPTSVTSIGGDAFLGCSSLTHIVIPNSVTGIGTTAFLDCSGLSDVTIGTGVSSIGDYAFTWCTSLTAVYFLANAPTANSETFNYSPMATVYYLPGTTGWGPTFGGRPTNLWKPRVQTGDASFGVRTNRFGFNISWADGWVVVVEACTNLANPNWSPVGTNTLTSGSSYFSDPEWTNYPARLYRIRSP